MSTPQLINPKKTGSVLSASPDWRNSRKSIDPTLLEIQNRIFEVEEFLPTLGEYKKKLEDKKSVATSVIQEKMKELHALINKWEARFVDTARETLDDKVEALNQQEEKLKDVLKDMQDILHQNRDKVSTLRRDLLNNNAEEDASLDDSQTDEEVFSADEELKKQLEKIFAVQFPLKPDGVKQEEFNMDNLKVEFKGLLDEARKSLKRSLAFAGGIVRGYLRRGQKNEKWVPMLRRLEARTEVNEEIAAQVSSQPDVTKNKPNSTQSNALPYFQLKSRAEAQNRVWKAVSDLFKYRNNLSLRTELSKNLAQLHLKHAAEIEFYLPQLVTIMLNKKDFQPLEQFVMEHSRDSLHFALQVYLLIRSMGDSGPEKWRKRCRKMLKKVEAVIPTEEEMKERIKQTRTPADSPVKFVSTSHAHPTIEVQPTSPTKNKQVKPGTNGNGNGSKTTATTGTNSNNNNNLPVKPVYTSAPNPGSGYVSSPGTSPDEYLQSPPKDAPHITMLAAQKTPGSSSKSLRVKGKEYFFETVRFLDELVDISRELTAKYGLKEKYMPELTRLLTNMATFITSGYAYIDDSDFRHKVLQIPIDECTPIQTYGRVLYFLTLEVLDIPTNYTREMADEYMKLAELMTREHRAGSDSEPSSLTLTNSNSGTSAVFGESFREKRKRIKAQSEYGNLPQWNLQCWIIKEGDNVLQEQFVMQLVTQFQRIWEEESVPLKLHPYRILATNWQSGLIEVVPNAISIDKLKQKCKEEATLLAFFKKKEIDMPNLGRYRYAISITHQALVLTNTGQKEFSDPLKFEQARRNFVSSLAAYSLVCYFLQIKDRHNANIMIDSEGHIVHIDFGYLLTRTIKFEKVPFKLTEEFIELMGGEKSELFKEYVNLCIRGFIAARKHYEKILLIVEMTYSEGGAIPCLEKESAVKHLRKRFYLEWNAVQCEEFVINLIAEARDNWRTTIYDTYQRILNDINF